MSRKVFCMLFKYSLAVIILSKNRSWHRGMQKAVRANIVMLRGALLRGERKREQRLLYARKDPWRYLLHSTALGRVNCIPWLGCIPSLGHSCFESIQGRGLSLSLASGSAHPSGPSMVLHLQGEERKKLLSVEEDHVKPVRCRERTVHLELMEEKCSFKIWKLNSRWNKQVYSNSRCCLLWLKSGMSTLIPY